MDNRLVSDRPIDAVPADPLGLGSFARGISLFLRNEKTHPPLTIALDGDWGTGKSSILALLRADLVAHNVPVVWFKAWQNETEQSILASVLQRIGEAVPSWWSLRGVIFHGRLLAIRMAHRKHLLLGLAALVTFLSGYLAVSHRGSLLASMGSWLPRWQTIQQAGLRIGLWLIAAAPVLALLISLADLLLKGRTLSGRVKRSELLREQNFRSRLAEDFRDIGRAFRPRILTLLVDDLHQCPPKAVVNVLEAVSFLVSAGNCFVVIGMTRDEVKRNIGVGFSTLFAETSDDGNERGKSDESMRHRLEERSTRYLNKLINLQVAVPVPHIERAWNSAFSTSGAEETPPSISGLWHLWLPYLRKISAFLVVFGIGARVGKQFPLVQASHPGVRLGAMTISWLVASWFSCVAAFCLLAGIYVFARWFEKRSRPLVSDSRAFLTAIGIWQPLIFQFAATPRTLKQFITELRLALPFSGHKIPEGHAVALFTLFRLDKEILGDDEIDRGLESFLKRCSDARLCESITTAWSSHRDAFAGSPSASQVKLFRESLGSLYVG